MPRALGRFSKNVNLLPSAFYNYICIQVHLKGRLRDGPKFDKGVDLESKDDLLAM
jgi:hypothetical protein